MGKTTFWQQEPEGLGFKILASGVHQSFRETKTNMATKQETEHF